MGLHVPQAQAKHLAKAGLVALVIWLFRETLVGGGIFFRRDILLVWYPQVETFVRAVSVGSWPFWNPSLGFGQPLLADPSAQVLYPPTWLNLVVRPWHYYTAYVVAHALLAAFGVLALATAWSVSRVGSFLAAALFVLSGPYLSFIDLWHHFAGASWLPLVVFTADRALKTRGRRAVIVWALVLAAQILAGSADMCVLALALVALLAVVKHVAFRPPFFAANRALLVGAIGGSALALGLTAGLWLPALDVVSRAARSDLPQAVRTYWSVHPLVLLELIVPGLFTSLPLAPSLRAAFFESREPFLASLYLGAPALGLVAAGLFVSRHPLRGLLGGVAVGALLVALGSHTPAYDLLAFLLPPLRILRYPVKVMALVALCFGLLAGIGYDAWRTSTSRAGWLLAVVLPCALLGLFDLGLALWLSLDAPLWAARLLTLPEGVAASDALRPMRFRLMVAGGIVVTAGLLALARRQRPTAAAALATGISALAVCDLAAYHRHPSLVGPRALATYRPEILDAVAKGARMYVYDYSARGESARGASAYRLARRPDGWNPDAAHALGMQMYLAPESLGRWGLRGSYEVDYRGLYAAPLADATRRLREAEGTPAHLGLLRRGAVDHVLALHDQGFEDLVPRRRATGVFEEPIRLFDVPATGPRVYAAPASAFPGAAAGSVVVEADAGSGFVGDARIIAERPDAVSVQARLSGDGFVVLVDGYDPGWRARVDGRPVPVLRANEIFRAVEVPAGEHLVEFSYRPWSVLVGLGVSLLALLVAGGLGMRPVAGGVVRDTEGPPA